jgi:hypothetical protein
MKLSARYGCMLLCGWLPPVFDTVAAFMNTPELALLE